MLQLSYIQLLILVLLGSFGITFFYRKLALKHSILDIPNERSSHETPVPKGGGIAIVLTFYSVLLFIYLTGRIERSLFFALLPGMILALVGFFDDFWDLNKALRLLVQILCSGIALFILGGFDVNLGDNLKWAWSFIALIGFVWFINLFNFLDGSDGYASMEAISILLALWYFTESDVLLILLFSVVGFLFWNWPKAKIFMGDTGSTTLGFILAVFGLYFHNTHTLNFHFWLILTALFWFDATITLLRRIIYNEKLSQAHKNHIYQRAIQGGFSHLRILLVGLGINILLFFICFLVLKNYMPTVTGFLVVLIIMSTVMKYVDRKFAYSRKKDNPE